jgi:hypothetical protein
MKDEKKEQPIKPKTSVPPVDIMDTFSDAEAGDRIEEKLSISVPTQPLLKPTGLGRYFNQRVRVLCKDGNVMKGFLQGRRFDYLHFLNIEETGGDEKTTADWCGVKIDGISRIYPGNAKVEKISTP